MRPPDLYIGPKSNPQTSRWHLLRWRGLQVALHRWHRSDDDRALHDHSGHNVSILLTGCYTEITYDKRADPTRVPVAAAVFPFGYVRRKRIPFVPYFRFAAKPHRVELTSGPIWSLWIRFPPIREWGFWCRSGWKHWKDYCGSRDYSAPGSESVVGEGCG
jgi:hypothetical protein